MDEEDRAQDVKADLWNVVADDHRGRARLAIRIWKGSEILRTVRMEPDITYIGRMPENHVVLDDPRASRSHARIFCQEGKFILEDQHSENGTLVANQKIQRHELAVGDRIGIGDHVLEVVPAESQHRTATRESQLESAQEEEWRLDQTVSLSPEELARRLKAGEESQESGKKRGTAKKVPPPKMTVSLQVGDKTITREFAFEKGEKRSPEPGQRNELEIRLSLGRWVLKKTLPL